MASVRDRIVGGAMATAGAIIVTGAVYGLATADAQSAASCSAPVGDGHTTSQVTLAEDQYSSFDECRGSIKVGRIVMDSIFSVAGAGLALGGLGVAVGGERSRREQGDSFKNR